MSAHDDANEARAPQAPDPHPKLRALDALEGTWRLEGRDLAGGAPFTGTITRHWLPGGHFLVQQMHVDGEEHAGAEYIGYDHAQETLRSMFFSNEGAGPFGSFALEYIWQIEDDRLTIWHGYKDSPAQFTGTIDSGRGVVSGRWEWPGGGYEAITTRQPEPSGAAAG